MAKDQKIIRAKAGLLDLPKQLGDVGQASKIMGFEPARRRSDGGDVEALIGIVQRCRRSRAGRDRVRVRGRL